jgi:hypothetical protein
MKNVEISVRADPEDRETVRVDTVRTITATTE